jgi:ribosomal protein S18 acetylase RimI-like enzyme
MSFYDLSKEVRILLDNLNQAINKRDSKTIIVFSNQIDKKLKDLRKIRDKELDPAEYSRFNLEELEKSNLMIASGNLANQIQGQTNMIKILNSWEKKFSEVYIFELLIVKSPRLKESYNLLNQTFKKGELDDFSLFQECCEEAFQFNKKPNDQENTRFLVAVQNGMVLGAAWVTYIVTSNIGFLWYIATSKEARGKGIGTLLRLKAIDSFNEDAKRTGRTKVKGVFGEIAKNSPWLKKLISEYSVIPLDIVYVSPRVGSVAASVDNYILYFQPFPRSDVVPSKELYQMVYDIFKFGYWMNAPEKDPQVKQTLDSIKNKQFIGSRKI